MELVVFSMADGIPSRPVLLWGSNFNSLEQYSLASIVCRLYKLGHWCWRLVHCNSGLNCAFNATMCLYAGLLIRTVLTMCSLHSVKSFPTKTSRDIGRMLCVPQIHLCLHGKPNWQKNVRNKEGYHSMKQPTQVNILWLQDTFATLSPSLHSTTNASYIIWQAALTLTTQTTTLQSEDQSTYLTTSKSGIGKLVQWAEAIHQEATCPGANSIQTT